MLQVIGIELAHLDQLMRVRHLSQLVQLESIFQLMQVTHLSQLRCGRSWSWMQLAHLRQLDWLGHSDLGLLA